MKKHLVLLFALFAAFAGAWHAFSDSPASRPCVCAYAVPDYLLPLEEYSQPREYAPELIMLHFTSAVVPQPDDPYDMEAIRRIFADSRISCHYIVARDGEIRCYIPENRVAWHAGKGEWNGDPKYSNMMNHYAIGIEIAAIGSQSDMLKYVTAEAYQALDDSLKGYTDAQYRALKRLVHDLCSRYGIPAARSHVIGHQAYSPGKRDPGELFDWSRILPR